MLFRSHVDLEEDFPVSRFEMILEHVEEVLKGFGIHHFNIQPELHRADTKELIHPGTN